MIIDKRQRKIYEGGYGLVFVGEHFIKSIPFSLSKVDENFIEI